MMFGSETVPLIKKQKMKVSDLKMVNLSMEIIKMNKIKMNNCEEQYMRAEQAKR